MIRNPNDPATNTASARRAAAAKPVVDQIPVKMLPNHGIVPVRSSDPNTALSLVGSTPGSSVR